MPEHSGPIKVELWDIEKIIPYEANAKKHPEEQVAKLATAIQKFGWTQPITVWKNGEIIAGHGRRLAAIKLGMKKVPVVVRSDLSKAAADALRLADNRVTSTDYDQEAVQEELRRLSEELEGSDIDLTDMGFDMKEIDFTMGDLGAIDDSFFTEDVAEAVENQRIQNEESVSDTDQTAAPVGDAMGFKRVTIEQSRQIRSLMLKMDEVTGSTGVDSFIEFLSGNLE